ncbi:MAG: carboxypeptidase-like regulatory domain-containing protein [Prolixibacteraceae bacterium]|jgi:hypothetical protein
MKKSLILLFIFSSSLFASAQISGKVTDGNSQPVEFATVFNLRNKMSSVTNVTGEFSISGLVGDSIRIQHLNFNQLDVIVLGLNNKYVLREKFNIMSEIPVTAGYVMIRKSCENTYNRFKDKNISRGYLRYFSASDKDTTQIIDVDLDIVQQKLKDFNKGERISPFKVQERNRSIANNPFSGLKPLFLNINFINDWSVSVGRAQYKKSEDDLFYKYYFAVNDSVEGGIITGIEVVIQKSDTCLLTVKYFTTFPLQDKEGKNIKIRSHCWYIKYEYKNGFAYLSESMSKLILPNPKNIDNDLSVSLFFRTYDDGSENLKRRPNGNGIFFNSWLQSLIKNRYQEEFWASKEYLNFDVNIFDSLLNMKGTVENGYIWSGKIPRTLGYTYYIHKDKF